MVSTVKSQLSKVVTMGGGGGHAAVVRALKDLPIELAAVCNTVDDGGSSGHLMREYSVHHPGEVRQILSALSVFDALEYRFPDGSLQGLSIGNMLLAGLELKLHSFGEAVEQVRSWLDISQVVTPLTENNPVLHAYTTKGKEIVGQAAVATYIRSSPAEFYESISITPSGSPLSEAAREAFVSADYIVVCMGDLYSSIGPLFCVKELVELWPTFSGKVIWLSNAVQTPNHVHYASTFRALAFLQSLNPHFIPEYIIAHAGEIPELIEKELAARGYGLSQCDVESSYKTEVVKVNLLSTAKLREKIPGDVIDRSPVLYNMTELMNVLKKIIV